ncbi:SpoIIAA family protein [Kangiella sediminilitoris]|uniref:STAS/SEC14 domain-containing protein n=1 Tax=Kangiella sediminilitoris TaxID=1144748 RepID=A0A1B3B7M5_9GAMM|nr:STAS/SEC14 domain-containing protein [Kangiella sediminilitoris]AOE48792.1 hypothetical protein KS2013_60 [Kangiella sediminilitoris]
MLHVTTDTAHALAILEPEGALTDHDFQHAAQLIDPVIEKHGKLNGIIIRTRSFPGWDSFAALMSHLRFVREHHKHVGRIALVTDSALGSFGESVASHFVSAEIKHYAYDDFQAAKNWVLFGE